MVADRRRRIAPTVAGHAGIGLRGTAGRPTTSGAQPRRSAARHHTSQRPGNLTASAGQLDPDRPLLERRHGQLGHRAQYLIERCSGSRRTFAQVATVGGATTSYPNTGLSPSTAYSYRVRADDAAPTPNRALLEHRDCDDARSARHDASERPRRTSPRAPSARPRSTSPGRASTDDVAASSRVPDRALLGLEPCTFAEVATVGGTTTSYSNTGLSPSTAYTYRVRAQDAGRRPQRCRYSNTATDDDPRPPDTTPPSAPGTLTASASARPGSTSPGARHRRLGHRRAVPDRALLGLALHLRPGRDRRRERRPATRTRG